MLRPGVHQPLRVFSRFPFFTVAITYNTIKDMIMLAEFFRTNVRRYMRQHGCTQESLARTMNVSQPYISQIVTGKFSPGLDVVENVASALEIDPLDLLRPPPEGKKKNK
jgi:ribosome-binding protein aMBF1 (putative translation factor)